MNLAKYSLLVMLILILSAPLSALASDNNDSDSILDNYEFEVDFVNGYLSGGPLAHTITAGDTRINLSTKNSWITGFRFDADKEYYGFELSLLGTSQNVGATIDDIDDDTKIDNTTWLMTSINALLYPTGNKLADGNIKPYITLGPGLAYIDNNLDGIDGKMLYDANIGIGIKFKFGEKKNFVVRIDYRWHHFMGGDAPLTSRIRLDQKKAKIHSEIDRHEFTVGLGIIF